MAILALQLNRFHDGLGETRMRIRRKRFDTSLWTDIGSLPYQVCLRQFPYAYHKIGWDISSISCYR